MSNGKWGNKAQIERNSQITEMVLNGKSCTAVAIEFKLTHERIRQITAVYCRTANHEKYLQMPKCSTTNLLWLRENKAEFLSKLPTTT